MSTLRDRLVSLALEWEQTFGVAPQITSALSEYDAAMLMGMSELEYAEAMRRATAVQRGHDFVHKGIRYQVKGTRPSGKPGSKITKVPSVNNFDWDVLIWICYDTKYDIQEGWSWQVADYKLAFEAITRISPAHMRAGLCLRGLEEA
jgi:hypothetical protein